MMSRDHTLKPKKTNVRVSGTYGEMFTIPLVFHVLAYVPQCTSSMHLLFGVYGGVIDVDSEPDDHSEVLPLFVGCIVNFIVSYLICMFQDSVPAGSYNDPFLSSVCV